MEACREGGGAEDSCGFCSCAEFPISVPMAWQDTELPWTPASPSVRGGVTTARPPYSELVGMAGRDGNRSVKMACGCDILVDVQASLCSPEGRRRWGISEVSEQ